MLDKSNVEDFVKHVIDSVKAAEITSMDKFLEVVQEDVDDAEGDSVSEICFFSTIRDLATALKTQDQNMRDFIRGENEKHNIADGEHVSLKYHDEVVGKLQSRIDKAIEAIQEIINKQPIHYVTTRNMADEALTILKGDSSE